MGTRSVPLVVGESYHLYNRGNSKQVIFKDDFDYQRFQILLYLSNSDKNFKIGNLRKTKQNFFTVDRGERLVSIGAYCLMPNHFHILLTPQKEEGVSLFMKKLGTGYSMFFNKRYARTGALFEGKFKSQWADDDQYLKYLFSYIHLNPMKLVNREWKETGVDKKMIDFVSEYRHSSYWDFCNPEKRREHKILNLNTFPAYFNKHEKVSHIYQWLELGKT